MIPGEAPGVLKLSQDSPQEAPIITLIEYGPDCLEERKDVGCDELLRHLNNELVTWINIDGLGDLSVLRTLGERFNLHPLALEDVLDTSQRPKVEQYDDYLFIDHQDDLSRQGEADSAEQVSMFLGKTFLITLQEEADFDVFEPVRRAFAAAKAGFGTPGPTISPMRCSTPSSIIIIRCWSRSGRDRHNRRRIGRQSSGYARSAACTSTNALSLKFAEWSGPYVM